jgi:hypothetical protein
LIESNNSESIFSFPKFYSKSLKAYNKRKLLFTNFASTTQNYPLKQHFSTPVKKADWFDYFGLIIFWTTKSILMRRLPNSDFFAPIKPNLKKSSSIKIYCQINKHNSTFYQIYHYELLMFLCIFFFFILIKWMQNQIECRLLNHCLRPNHLSSNLNEIILTLLIILYSLFWCRTWIRLS